MGVKLSSLKRFTLIIFVFLITSSIVVVLAQENSNGSFSTFEFFAYVNLSSDMTINGMTEKLNITIV